MTAVKLPYSVDPELCHVECQQGTNLGKHVATRFERPVAAKSLSAVVAEGFAELVMPFINPAHLVYSRMLFDAC